ncbi:SCO6880 family protein [Streptomyces aculeolatus]
MSSPARMYGGWRQTRGIGLDNLTTTQSLILLGLLVAASGIAAADIRLMLYAGPLLLLAAAATAACWRGEPLLEAVTTAVRWRRARQARQNAFTSGVLTLHDKGFDLPGILAPVTILSAEDGDGGHYGLAWHRRSGHLTATLRVAAISTALADQDAVDTWVSAWGAWLARLGHTPTVRWVAVTVDTAPDPGSSLQDYVAARLDPRAPAAAKELVHDLVAASPAASAAVETRVSITFDPARAIEPAETYGEAVAEVGRTLAGLQHGIGGCGVTVLGRASAARLAGITRAAFDPASRPDVARALAPDPRAGREAHPEALLDRGAAGPVGAREHRDHYRHDSGTSTSWVWAAAPRQHVTSEVLVSLLAPARHPKRVTLMHEPHPAEVAADQLDKEVNAAAFRSAVRQRQQRAETATDAADRQRAQQAAAEEAQGAGLGLYSLAVTTTVTDPTRLPGAAADVEQRAGTAKIKLRRARWGQAAAFAATLPLGIYLPDAARRRTH